MPHRLRCTYMERARSEAAREVGCPLDHCFCGTHDTEHKEHTCPCAICGSLTKTNEEELCAKCAADPSERQELMEEIRQAEADAGWDPSP